MARALSTSEANQYLLSLGFEKDNVIEDNEMTLPFGKTEYYIEEGDNMFDKEHLHRWWYEKGCRFFLNIIEWSHGRSFLTISKSTSDNGYSFDSKTIVNYAKLNAKDKKKFIQIFEELAKRKQVYHLEQTNYGGNHIVWGDALPDYIKEKE